MLLKLHPENPSPRIVSQVMEILKGGGVIIFPTDTIYAIGCDSNNLRAFERLCKIRGVKPHKASFSFLFSDLSQISKYTRPFDRNVFKLLKAHLPGSYTFILPAGNEVPVLYRNNRKTIGIRIPDNGIVSAFVSGLGNPLVSSSLHDDEDDIATFLTDPEEIHDRYANLVDAVIDGGYGKNIGSTVIDCTGSEPVITRQGLGELK